MNHARKFDTLEYSNALKKVGLQPEIAEKLAELQADMTDNDANTLATKADLNTLELKIDTKISSLEATIIKWVVGISFAQAALIVSLLKFIH